MGACRSKSASGWAKRTGSTTIVVQSKGVVEGEDELAVDTNPPASVEGKVGAAPVTAVPTTGPSAGSPGRTIPPVGAASTAPPAKSSTASAEVTTVPADTPTEAPSAPLTAAERRALAVAAAEKRASNEIAASGLSEEAAAKMKERRTKDELLGKIEDRCRRLGKEVPFGLRTASVEALRKHLEVLNGQISARALQGAK